MSRYEYSINDGRVKNTSLAWRMGDLTDDLYKSNTYRMHKVLNEQNEKLKKFFNRSDVSKFTETGDWYILFKMWDELKYYNCDVLGVFLIHQAGVDFLSEYSDEGAQEFIDTFGLCCEKVG